MLINLHGKVSNDNTIKFDLPCVYLQSETYICATELCITFSKKVDSVTGNIFTSLVDKSALNPNQDLIFFTQREKSRILYFSPTHLSEYKIQGNCLTSSEFILYLNYTDNIRENLKATVEDIYLQLSIKCKDSARH